MAGLNLALPLQYAYDDGPYKTNKTFKDMIRTNLRVLFLTNPGERIMDYEFGIGIYRFLFENLSPSLISEIQTRVYDQVSRYMPYVRVQNFQASKNDNQNRLNLSMSYSIDGAPGLELFEMGISR